MKLDVKDLRILQRLDADPRMRLSALAKRVRLSQQVVDYRVKRLVSEGLITSFGTVLNLVKLGFEQYRVLVQLGDVSEEEKQRVLAYVRGHGQVYWAALVGGTWDLLVVVFVRNYKDFERFLDDIFKEFPRTLRDYEALYSLYHEFYPHKYLYESTSLVPLSLNVSVTDEVVKLDKVDACLLGALKGSCRLSSLEIGKRCGVSYKTVQYRVRELERKGVIAGYRLFVKSELLGFKAFLVLLSFQSYGREVEEQLWRFARGHSFITQMTKVFGRWSVMVHLRVKDERELQRVVVQVRNRFPIVGGYEIIPVFEDVRIDQFPMVERVT